MKRSMMRRHALAALASTTLMLLAACGGGGDDDGHDHDDDHGNFSIDTAGRLATIESGASTVRIHDLDDSNAVVEGSYTMDNVPSALYTSPQGRYAVVVQRLQDQVQFVDGGIWQEDHGDHLHDYKRASQAMSWKLTGSRPTHYDVQAGRQAAFFMDGNTSATPVQNAGVRLFNDASVAKGQLLASMDLGFPIHGLGEPVGNKLVTVSRASDATDTLPTHLNLYQRSDSTYTFDRQLPVRCNGMHGSFSSGSHTLVGCSDGMLLVRHTYASTTDDGRKLTTPLRVGTIAGHPRLPDHFIGIANDGVAPAPVTTRFYAVDAAAATVADLVPQGWTTGNMRRAHGFDRSGQRFYVLDNQGTLILMQRQAAGWSTVARVTGAIPAMPTAAPWPAIVANGAKDVVYLTDPVARQWVAIDATNGAVQTRHALSYVPSGAAWLGITR